MTGPCFIDTGFVIALVSPRDRYHAIAKHLSDQIEADGTRLVTSQAIILEIGAALSKSAFRPAAVRLIEAMQSDPLIDVIPVSDERLQHAFALFKERADKEWSLADCLSFDIMRERGIVDALTPDMHFAQAGFAVLMRDG